MTGDQVAVLAQRKLSVVSCRNWRGRENAIKEAVGYQKV